jgi:hypothetical protein
MQQEYLQFAGPEIEVMYEVHIGLDVIFQHPPSQTILPLESGRIGYLQGDYIC